MLQLSLRIFIDMVRRNKKIQQTLYRQLDAADCGAACILSLLQFYDGTGRIDDIRARAGTTVSGTTLLGLCQAARELGFVADGCEAEIDALIEHNMPVILLLRPSHVAGNHYVVCYGYENERFTIGDPSLGIIYYSREDLASVWISKACLVLSPSEDFVTNEKNERAKTRWFLDLIKEEKELLFYSIVLGLIVSTLGLASAVFSQRLIDKIIPSTSYIQLFWGLSLFAFLLCSRALLEYVRRYLLALQTERFNLRITNQFYVRILTLPRLFFDRYKRGDIVARLNDVQRLQRVIAIAVGDIVVAILSALVSLFFIFYYSSWLGLLVLLASSMYVLLILAYRKDIQSLQLQVMQGYAFCESHYISTLDGIDTIRALQYVNIFTQLHSLIYGEFQRRVKSLSLVNAKLSSLADVCTTVFLVLVIGGASLFVWRGDLLPGSLIALISLSGTFLSSIGGIALFPIQLSEARVALERMHEFTSTQMYREKERVKIIEIPVVQIDFQRVYFRYNGQRLLLSDVNFSVNKGECLALFGESGCGKSTLLRLLQGVYQPTEGFVLLNGGTSLHTIREKEWLDQLGVVPQDITLFNGTILDNMMLPEGYDVEQVKRFVLHNGFDRFIDALPQGLYTLVGENGVQLSGGQKKILALIRVLIRSPRVLLLDEFTEGLDRQSERIVINLLNKHKQQMLIVLASHNLRVINAIADKILVLECGRVSAYGVHDALMSEDNLYSHSWNTARL